MRLHFFLDLYLTEWDVRLSDRDGLDRRYWRRCHGTYDRVALLNVSLSVCVCLHVCMYIRLLTALPWHLRSRCVIECLFAVVCVFACLYVYEATDSAAMAPQIALVLFQWCMHVCVFVYVCVSKYTHIHMYAHIHTYTIKHTHTYLHIHHTYVCIHTHVRIHTYVFIHTHTYAYIHIYAYIHSHTHAFIPSTKGNDKKAKKWSV